MWVLVVRGWMPRALAFDERVTVELRCHNLFVDTGETVTQTQYLVFRPRERIEAELHDAGFELEAVPGRLGGHAVRRRRADHGLRGPGPLSSLLPTRVGFPLPLTETTGPCSLATEGSEVPVMWWCRRALLA